MSRLRVKIGLVVAAAIAATLNFAFTSTPNSTAKADDILTEIATYRTWTKINKKPIQALPPQRIVDGPPAFTIDGAGG